MIVDTTAGKVEGLERAGILQFRGIPFAVADRFCAPEAPRPWTGILDATEFGPVAPQGSSPTDSLLGIKIETYGEDCLHLNVFTPAADDARRPVMVWIHGGGFVSGSGSLPFYNATNLALNADVVVVTINYRLGALGFLHLDQLVDGFAGSGLNGIRDQVAALEWVRDNASGFGGDPGNVTVFGESAGSMSVATLMGTPAARGLFHRAICQSGAADNLLTPDQAATVAERLLFHLELEPSDAEELFDVDAEKVVEAQNVIEAGLFSQREDPDDDGPAYLQLPFQPVVDGRYIPCSPLESVRAGSAAGVPLLVGTTRDEWNMFALAELGSEISDERLLRRAERLVGDELAPVAVELYRACRPEESRHGLWRAMATDKVFRMPAIRLAEAQLAHGDVAMYRFDYAATSFGGLAGACHGIDVPFVFDNLHLRGMEFLLGGVDDGTHGLAGRCARAWGTMARTGAPATDELDWPSYDTERRATCLLDRSPTVVDDPEGEIRAFWLT